MIYHEALIHHGLAGRDPDHLLVLILLLLARSNLTRVVCANILGARIAPPQPASVILDYQRHLRRQTSGPVVRRVRPERHNPRSITTLRMVLARYLFGGIPQCPFCGSRPG